jgi:hypothetical protein
MAEKRRCHRQSQRLRVNVWEHGRDRPTVGYTENVSAQGMFLSMSQPLRIGSKVRLEVLADEQSFMAEGVVAHTRRVPQELQKVKQAGMGISLLPFESFLQDVRPSGMTMTASGVWRMESEALTAGERRGERAARKEGGGRRADRSRAAGDSTRSGSASASESARAATHPTGSYAREDPHQRVSSAKLTLDEKARKEESEDEGLAYPVRFDGVDDFLRRYDTDVRMGIFFVHTRAPAPKGTRVVLDISPPGARRPVRLAAESVRGGGPGAVGAPGMLVRFQEPSAAIDALGVFARALRPRGES